MPPTPPCAYQSQDAVRVLLQAPRLVVRVLWGGGWGVRRGLPVPPPSCSTTRPPPGTHPARLAALPPLGAPPVDAVEARAQNAAQQLRHGGAGSGDWRKRKLRGKGRRRTSGWATEADVGRGKGLAWQRGVSWQRAPSWGGYWCGDGRGGNGSIGNIQNDPKTSKSHKKWPRTTPNDAKCPPEYLKRPQKCRKATQNPPKYPPNPTK